MIENQMFSDSESDEDECRRFFSVCAENKINAMIARMREYDESFERPEEFENEAVSMAIKQHGLKNCKNQSMRDSFRECSCEINENHCNQSMVEGSSTGTATTSKTGVSSVIENCNDEDLCSKSKQRRHCSNSEIQNLAYKQNINSDNFDFDDVDFLNEAVAVAIKKKGLTSSPCNALQ